MSKSKAYHAELIEGLRDPIEAEEYLNAALEEEDPRAVLGGVEKCGRGPRGCHATRREDETQPRASLQDARGAW